jgi:hypothetical protein
MLARGLAYPFFVAMGAGCLFGAFAAIRLERVLPDYANRSRPEIPKGEQAPITV